MTAVVELLTAIPAAAIASGVVALVEAGASAPAVTGVGLTMMAAVAAAITVVAGVPSCVAVCDAAPETSSLLVVG